MESSKRKRGGGRASKGKDAMSDSEEEEEEVEEVDSEEERRIRKWQRTRTKKSKSNSGQALVVIRKRPNTAESSSSRPPKRVRTGRRRPDSEDDFDPPLPTIVIQAVRPPLPTIAIPALPPPLPTIVIPRPPSPPTPILQMPDTHLSPPTPLLLIPDSPLQSPPHSPLQSPPASPGPSMSAFPPGPLTQVESDTIDSESPHQIYTNAVARATNIRRLFNLNRYAAGESIEREYIPLQQVLDTYLPDTMVRQPGTFEDNTLLHSTAAGFQRNYIEMSTGFAYRRYLEGYDMENQLDAMPVGATFYGAINQETTLPDFAHMFPVSDTIDFVIQVIVTKNFRAPTYNGFTTDSPIYANNIVYHGLASLLVDNPNFDELVDPDALGYGYFRHTVKNMYFLGKKIKLTPALRSQYMQKRVVRAAGFGQKVLPARSFTFGSGMRLFFPTVHGDHCLYQCALEACEGIEDGLEEGVTFIKELFAKNVCRNGSGWKLRKKGFSTKKILSLNLQCKNAFTSNSVRTLFEFVLVTLHESNKLLPRRPSALSTQFPSVYVPITIVMVHFNGQFHKRTPGTQNEIPGGCHYCLIHGQLTGEIEREMFESALRTYIQDSPFGHLEEKMEMLYGINKTAVAESEKAAVAKAQYITNSRMNREQRQADEGVEPEPRQRTAQTVFVADMECLFERFPGDRLDLTVKEIKRVLSTGFVQHVPVCFAYCPLSLDDALTLEYDLTTTGEELKDLTEAVLLGERPTVVLGEDLCINRAVRDMAETAARLNMTEVYVYLHNACKYDSYQILHYLQPEEGIRIPCDGLLKTPRGILNLDIAVEIEGKPILLKFRCTKVYFAEQLKSLCKTLKVPMDYWKKEWVWGAKTCITRRRLEDTDYVDKLVEYQEYDIYSLAFVLLRMEKLLRTLAPYRDLEKAWKPRVRSVTFQSFLRSLLSRDYLRRSYPPNEIIEYDDLLMSSLRGGVCMPVTREFHLADWLAIENLKEDVLTSEKYQYHLGMIMESEHGLVSLDANSLYPFAQKRPMPVGPGVFLHGEDTTLKFNDLDKEVYPECWSICVVQFQSFPDCSFPLYSTRGPHGLTYEKPVYGERYCHTLDDMIIFHWLGAKFTFLSSVWWEGDCVSTEYNEFIDSVYTLKSTTTDPLLRNIYKLALVSAFGITGFESIKTKTIVLHGDEQIDSTEFYCGRVSEFIPLDSCNVVTMQGIIGHTYQGLSNKSSLTNCILSRARYHMFFCLRKAGRVGFEQMGRGGGLLVMLGVVNYMDTDSLFVPKYVVEMFDRAGLIGDDLGQFKNDYSGVIASLICVCPKVRQQVVVSWSESAGRYKAALKTKFKGVNLQGCMKSDSTQRKAFTTLARDWCFSSVSPRWVKTVEGGVSTGHASHEITTSALLKNKVGLYLESTPEKVQVRFIPKGIEDSERLLRCNDCLFFPEDENGVAGFIEEYSTLLKTYETTCYDYANEKYEQWKDREEYNSIYHPCTE